MTTDDHTCVLLLDDVALRQVLAARESDDRAMVVRLNLATVGVPHFAGRFIGRSRHSARTASATDRARHPSAGRHAAIEPVTPARQNHESQHEASQHHEGQTHGGQVRRDAIHHGTAA